MESMDRQWVYAVECGGVWEVKSTDMPTLRRSQYATAELAVAAAKDIARSIWKLTCGPSGVRVQTPVGSWTDVHTFGTTSQADSG